MSLIPVAPFGDVMANANAHKSLAPILKLDHPKY